MAARVDHRWRLKEDHRIRAWHEENALRSKTTADVNLRQLSLLCVLIKKEPGELVRLAKKHPEQLRALLGKYAHDLQARGRLPSYVSKTFVGVKSWLAFNSIDFLGFPKLRVIQGESIRQERVPTQEELRRILATYPSRSRVVALFMAHTGVRPGVLGTIDGSNGLRLGDLRDLELRPELRFTRTPFHVVVPGRLSKTSVEYHTFGTPELADTLLAYLSERRARGEELRADSAVVTVDPMGEGNFHRQERQDARGETDFVSTPVLMRPLRSGLKALLPNARTYVFRAYCSTQFVSARIDAHMAEEFLGHSLGVRGRYNLSKKLHPRVIEELRAEYTKAVPFLESGPRRESRTETAIEILQALLRSKGIPPAKIEEILDGSIQGPELDRLLGAALTSSEVRQRERAVAVDEVQALLDGGWEFVSPLGTDHAIVRSPVALARASYPILDEGPRRGGG